MQHRTGEKSELIDEKNTAVNILRGDSYTVLYCTTLYCTTLYCTVLHCATLYYTLTHPPITARDFTAPWNKLHFAPPIVPSPPTLHTKARGRGLSRESGGMEGSSAGDTSVE